MNNDIENIRIAISKKGSRNHLCINSGKKQ